jgi:serine/threonine protein kinase
MTSKMLGKYELLEELGRGGFGTVYRARDTSLDVERAVKLLHPALASDPEFITRFKREAQFTARLEHPAIVPVYEFGELEGAFFLVMKYMPGGSLKDVLKIENRWPFTRALESTRQIASGLDRAHKQGLVHRDIKPGNILFEEAEAGDPTAGTGAARLSDFGFAKALSGAGSASLSASGGMVGTPAYMAPEIWRGEEISPTTDIYSLACVFYEMLTGQVLFDGNSPAQIMTWHVLEGPRFQEKWPEDTPEGIQAILTQALDKEPARRYQSAGAFENALERISMGERTPLEASLQVPPAPIQVEPSPAIQIIEKIDKENVQTVPADLPGQTGSKDEIPERSLQEGKSAEKIPLPAELRPRFAEKSMAYLLILFGLVTSLMYGLGLPGLIAGIGLFWHKKWARKLGMIFAGMLEVIGIISVIAGFVFIQNNDSTGIILALFGFPAFLLSLFFLETLGGKRIMAYTGGGASQPAGFWPIFIWYSATIFGLIPALLLLKHTSHARLWGFLYLFIVLIVAVVFLTHSDAGDVIVGAFLIGLCVWAFFTLQSRRFREAYDGEEQKK